MLGSLAPSAKVQWYPLLSRLETDFSCLLDGTNTMEDKKLLKWYSHVTSSSILMTVDVTEEIDCMYTL